MTRHTSPTIPHAQSPADRRPRHHALTTAALSMAALCLTVLASPAAAQWAAPSLFAEPPVPAAAAPHGLEAVEGMMDAAPALRGLGRLRLQLPGGGMVQMARDGFERRRNGDVTWRGRIVGEDDSRVILTIRNGYVAGRIFRGLDEYEIRPGPGRSHVIERVDTSIEPVDEHVAPDVDYSDDPDPGGLGTGFPPPYTNSPDNIQLLVFYTQQALATAGGEQQIEARIQSMVDQANAAFIDSGMIARISLIRAEEIAYAETGDVRSALDWLVGINPDGSYNYGVLAITAKREFFGADLVSMIVDNDGLCAGAAYVMNEPGHSFAGYAYSVSALSCGAGTLAHEIGHNMGFEHNPEDSPRPYSLPWWPYSVPTSYPWSFGHYVDGSFRTIMSYATPCLSGCPKALLFSNPDISFLGSPTGIVDQRDNARTGDLTAPIVTNFMDAVTGAVVNRRVIAATDDVEEMADGSIVLDSPVLDLGGVQAVGLRFQNIHIPPGMRIDSAYLEFEAADLGSVATSVEIRAEAADNAAPFSTSPFDVTGRPATLASVPWDVPAWDAVTEKHYSPDISAVVQEVLDRPGWLENNSLVITVEGIGLRTALSHDGDAVSAPLLHIEYASPDRPETIEAPVAAFSYSCTGLTCTFTDQSTDADGTIVSWWWSFDNYPFTYSTQEQNPTVTFPADGAYYVLLDIFDDQGWQGVAEKTINVRAANIDPVATDNAYTTDQDVAVSGNVLTDGVPDSDPENDPLSVVGNSSPLNGTVTIAADGAFTYTPSASFVGVDSFTYTIDDSHGGTATATVTITVNAVNIAPVATDNVYTTNEDVAVSGNVLTDGVPDSDADGDPITVTAITGPSFGRVTITADGAFSYYPDTDFFGSDSYSYTVSDGNGGAATATVTITVNPVSDMPVASANDYTTDEDVAVSGNVIADGVPDSDVDGDTLTVTANTSPLNGTLTMSANGAFTYAPAPEFSGTDSFDYTISDGTGGTASATVSITVNTVNDLPVATGNAYAVDEDTVLQGDVINDGIPDSDAEGDQLIVTSHTNPMFGEVVVGILVNNVIVRTRGKGDFTYTPNADFHGTDSFEYTVEDLEGGTATATVTITVNPVNDVPVAAFHLDCVDLTCSQTDESVDRDGTIASWSWNFGDGVTSTLQNPTHTYAADGIYTITLTVTDDGGASDVASQSIHVMVGNISPLATDNTYTTDEDLAVNGNLLTDGVPDSDVDGDALTVTANTSPLNGTVTVAPTGAFTFTPNPDFNGSDSFVYTAGDGNGGSDTATVTITVNPVNDAPVATDNSYTTDEDVPLRMNVLQDAVPDSDIDGDVLVVTGRTGAQSGSLSGSFAGGELSYTPGANFNGTDSFTYTISDGNGGTDTAAVTITVNAVNDPPVASFFAACTVLDCTFSNSSSDVEGPITWLWDFGDGTTSTVELPTHSYAAAGSYTVTLTVTDDQGATDTRARTFFVGNNPPVATNNAYTLDEDTTISGNFLTDGTPDSDPDGDPLTFSAQTRDLYGTVSINADGSFVYTPVPDYPASPYDFPVSDSFTYSISDGKGGFDSATVTFWINPINDAPVAKFYHYCNGLYCRLVDQSTDVEGPISSWSWDSGDGATYTIQSPFHKYSAYGAYTVSLTVTDGGGLTHTVTKTLDNPNYAPVGTDNYYTTTVDTPITGNVLKDGTPDSDANGDGLRAALNDGLISGEASIGISGFLTYTPAAGFVGKESFTYTVSDGHGGSDTAIVTITVNPANTAPVATDNAYTTVENVAVSGNVLTDGTPDSDADGDALSVTANSSPLNGNVAVAANGVFTYTPGTNFNGTDSFTYTVSDGTTTATATVTITVTPVNDPPVASFGSDCTGLTCAFTDASTDVEGPIASWSWSFGDGSVSTLQNPTHVYAGAGTYTVSLTVTDGGGATALATQSVTVANTAPVATANSYTVNEDTALSGNVLLDGTPDSDADGDPLTVTSNTTALNGAVTVAATGAFTYTPNADFSGADSFTYTVSDGSATATATVTITVNPVNDSPVAAFSHSCAGLTCAFTDGSSDIEGTIAAWSWTFGDGSVSSVQNPAHSYATYGTYDVSLTVTDGGGASNTVTQTVTVANTAPVATANAYSTTEDVALSGNVLTDGTPDSDADGDPLIVTANTTPLNGAVTVATTGAFTYTPNADFNGSDSFTYTVSDGIAAATANVTVTVIPVNDPPVAAFSFDCTSLTCAFSDDSTDVDSTIVYWSWAFGDGFFSSEQSPVHDYNVDGTYSVILYVRDSDGWVSEITQSLTVINGLPVATDNAYATAEDTAVSGNVLTDGVPDIDPDGDTLTVGPISSPSNGTLTIAANGDFTYTPAANFFGTDGFYYHAEDGRGARDEAWVTITVNPVNDAPVASFSDSCAGLNCAFADGSTDIEGTIASWSWTFGDGAVSTLQSPTHGYAANGTYTVSLMVTDNEGATDTATQTVTLANTAPVATDNAYTTAEDVALSGNVLLDGTPDSDADGDALTVTANSAATNGTVTVAANGAFTYTPAADFNGSDSFSYTVSDGVATATATITITVSPVNDAPVATDDAYTAAEDTALSGNVLLDGAPDSDADGDALSVTANSNPLNGTVAVGANGAFTYIPNTDFNGTDSFSYTVSDGIVTASATVTITVTPVNDAPVATANAYTTAEDVALSGNVMTDGTPDSDADGDALTVTANTSTLNGSVTVAANGAFTYTPNADFNGSDSFTYTVSDGLAAATATVTITVTPVNDAPVATENAYTTSEDTTLSGNVLLDGTPDSDADGDALTVTANSAATNGTVTVAATGAFTYTPNADFNGTDSFTYTVSDGIASAVATVTITVTPVNDAPVASFSSDCTGLTCVFNDGSTDMEGAIASWSWSFGDGSVSSVQSPTHGYAADGTYTVSLTVTDGAGATASATQAVTVANTAPVATANSYTSAEDTAVSGNVLTDGTPDSDADGDALAVTANSNPLNGTATVAANGAFTYTPGADFNGTDSFSYTISDGIATASATVTITVTPVNDAPVASFSFSCAGLNCAFADGSADVEGPISAWSWSFGDGSVSSVQNPAHGYAADGTYTVSLTVTDGAGATASATQAVTVANTVPVATADSYATNEDTAVGGNVLLDGTPDSDADGDPLTVTANTSPLNGTVTVAANGAFTYTPNADFNGSDGFSYTVSDGLAAATATVSITVNPVNDAPVATANAYTTSEDTALSGNVLTDGTPDSDPDGDALIVIDTTAALGSLSIAADGSFTYTPPADFNGTDSFDYSVGDPNGAGAIATVTITVTPVNDAPVATDNVYTTAEDIALSGNVLTDGTPDNDADGDVLTVTANTSPLSGTVTVAANGTFTYAPNSDFNGADSFSYTISDGLATTTATVTLTVTPVNDSPVASFSFSCTGLTCAFADASTDIEGAIASWSWSFGDGGVSTLRNPAHGYAADGTYTVTLTVSDSAGATDFVTHAVSVSNTAPVATANAYATDEDTVVSGNVLTDGAPDSDADGDALTVSANTTPLNGTVTVAANGAFTYTPNADFNGTDSFSYTASDGVASATAAVTITVNPVNDAPVATADAYTTDEDTAVSGNALTGGTPDSDADGDVLAVTANTSPLNGTVTVAANGAFTYTPNSDFNGADSFTYTVSDGVATAAATVTITVTPVNDAPVAGFGFACTDLDCVFTDSSTDIDGTIAAWSWDFGDGTASTAQSPTHSYAAVDGSYTVSLTVTDDSGATDTITQSVTVVNPFPPAAPTNLLFAVTATGNGSKAIMSVTLNWTDTAINEESYVIERCEIQGGGNNAICVYAPVVAVGAGTTSYVEDLPLSSYRYRVKARNRNGDSGYSNAVEILKQQV